MKYKTEEERKEARRESKRKYYQANKEKIAECMKQYYQDNREKILEQKKQYCQDNKEKIVEYRKTPMGRAINLISTHKQEDKKHNRGECTLTAKWVVDHIFSQKCAYCGESDWRKLGCDRIDNSLPHTPSNVICCCEACNKKRGKKSFEEFLDR